MPLREDLLEPIEGDNPSGPSLYYDKVFDQIKEARREEPDDLPEGDWARAQKKKADYPLVRKLAGEALAKRSKDLRLVAWLSEAEFKLEGLVSLAECLGLLLQIQESFWDTVHPEIEDGFDVELRVIAIESLAKEVAAELRHVGLTKNGLDLDLYLESRVVGFEKDAVTDQKKEARKKAIDGGKVCAEDFDRAVALTAKSFYEELETEVVASIELVGQLATFHEEKYAGNAPSLSAVLALLEQIHALQSSLLEQKRKDEPTPKPPAEPLVEPMRVPAADQAEVDALGAAGGLGDNSRGGFSGVVTLGSDGALSGVTALPDAYRLVVRSAEIFFDADPLSPVPYLICAGLRLGETRMQGPEPAIGFAIGPGSETRQHMRSLASKGLWKELLRASLPVLATESARGWLDLHRYIWKAAQQTQATALSEAVVGTVKGLLAVRPELRHWTLEDDTGAANPETQQWLDAVVKA